ncbi:MAG: peptide chain release factor N(5)-glutamine methyltransferase [Candidatus Moraniibacteriota bacterium]
MISIHEFKAEYPHKIDFLDLDLLICHTIKKEREFVLAHPEYKLSVKQELRIKNYVQRRLKNEPLAYILGEKEFYGLNFKVTPHTLIPRPETELMVELALEEIRDAQYSILNTVDIGTGSGNIITSLVHQLKKTSYKLRATSYFAIDISKEALKIAKQNAKHHNTYKEIKFLHGNLLDPILKSEIINHKSSLLILANLPYLSKEIYNACNDNVKKYEPKSALYSDNCGLAHYDQLLNQILKLKNNCSMLHVSCFMEISPEQKKLLPPFVSKYFPKAKIEFKKDLAQKWRICKIII